ncbi:hypothetical protein MKX01_010264 [Papaver californicum]|nr:hypothetical protein MKX01_010264 [Papaver californicum]
MNYNQNWRNHHKIDEIQTSCNQIITFSHFLPGLCGNRERMFPLELSWSIHGTDGSSSACHVFGHTHFYWDAVLQGIRYIQAPLAYPRERKRRVNGGEDWLPFCIYSSSKADRGIGSLSEKMSACYWSDYYSIHTISKHNQHEKLNI